MKAVNSANFNEEVLQSSVPVMVDFNAVWCGPCRNMKPLLEQMSSEANDKYKIVSVDIDENSDLAIEYNIDVVPTFVVFENGKQKKRKSGMLSRDMILESLS